MTELLSIGAKNVGSLIANQWKRDNKMIIIIEKEDVEKAKDLGFKVIKWQTVPNCYSVEVEPDEAIDYLKHIHNETEHEKALVGKKKLRKARELVADSAFEEYDFEKDAVEIIEAGHWRNLNGENDLIINFYYLPIDEEVDNGRSGSFIVEFKPNSTEVIANYANL